MALTTHTDANGVTREYREVKRKAAVGELVKITKPFMGEDHSGRVYTVVSVSNSDSGLVDTNGKYDDDSVFNPDATEYAVLEPTEIIHHDGKRYREVKREAKVGELVKIDYTPEDYPYFKSGEVGTVLRTTDSYIDVKFSSSREGGTEWSVGPAASNSTYIVLEPVTEQSQQSTAATDDRITQLEAEIEATKHRVAALERKLQVRDTATAVAERNDGALQKMADVIGGLYKPSVPVKQRSYTRADVPLTRERVIELAKKDVEELLASKHSNVPCHGDSDCLVDFDPLDNGDGYDFVEFVINRNKRTVVALLHNRYFSSTAVWARGIAKSSPDDCFNVHIGKAIALRRALGLDVPDYYVNAPKASVAQVGDIVKDSWNEIFTLIRHHERQDGFWLARGDKPTGTWHFAKHVTVIDDSHDFGGEQS